MDNINIVELKAKLDFMQRQLDEVETLSKIKFEGYDKQLADLESERKLQSFQYEQIMDSLKLLTSAMEDIKKTPSRNWNVFITAIITGLATFIIGYIAKVIK